MVDHGVVIAEGSPDELKRRVGGATVTLRPVCDISAVSAPLRRGLHGLADVLRRHPAPSPEGPGEAIVSLTFDDGVASQRVAAELLAERGLTATFYVASRLVGRSANLTWDDLQALAAQGHEIGGHTSGHVRLPALSRDTARSEVESDRLALLEHDLDPVTLAYPYGESSSEVEAIVREAGYAAARGVGGLLETIPPENPFRLRSPHSARAWTTAEHLVALVLLAEHEGGWMIVPFHHIEDGDVCVSSYTTPPAQLTEFLDWLVARHVRVARVRDVIAGLP